MRRATIRVTRHFARNLEDIEAFLCEVDAAAAFAPLLDDLFGQAIPALEQFPDLGTDFFRRNPSTREAAMLTGTLRERLCPGTALRELVRGDYLILYARRGDDLYLLAIKHHRQLSFDFPGHWQD
jgi:plasmid stabilization system protein ParE